MTGAELKSRRSTLGITLKELSDESGVSKPYLHRIEAGPQPAIVPSESICSLIEKALTKLESKNTKP